MAQLGAQAEAGTGPLAFAEPFVQEDRPILWAARLSSGRKVAALAAVARDLAPGSELIVDGAEWMVETFEPQVGKVVLMPADGPSWLSASGPG
ncbi:hypothetical protein [Streptomyces sp. NPDC001851]|uniref:hypothetical protein n=1 Tax=Streptomyces sp. NPDC001851 TaxID=3154529 RepID=UPI00331B51CE